MIASEPLLNIDDFADDDEQPSAVHRLTALVARSSTRRISPAALARYDARAPGVLARVQAIDVATFESAAETSMWDDLGPRAVAVLDEAVELFGLLLEETAEEVVAANDDGLADLAFIAQVDLRHRARRLAAMRHSANAAAVLAECDGALRRVVKALGAIERGRGDGRSRALDIDSELDVALDVRTRYVRFRARILELDRACGGTATERTLRTAGAEIASLVGDRIYPRLRLADRRELRALQQRLLVVLRAELDPAAAFCLWSDIVSFASMLAQVNRREELFEHDRRIVAVTLERARSAGRLDEATRAELARIEGRDDELDALLRAGDGDGEVILRLARLAFDLGTRAEGIR